jgi:DNA-binding LacI/PurR family transcriptional regulator
MNQLGYEPNIVARGLRSRATRTIGMVVPDMSNPFHSTLAESIEFQAAEAGYTVMLSLSHYGPDLEDTYLRNLAGKQVDGIIVNSASDTIPAVRHLRRQGVPTVVAGFFANDVPVDSVVADNRKGGGYLVARHLLDIGHRDIACFTGLLGSMQMRDRFAGFCDGLQEAGVSVRPEWVYHTPTLDFATTRANVQQLLQLKPLPTAVLFSNDYMALGGLSALYSLGLRVPDDISIIGFDDSWMSALSTPPLTTVRQPIREIGERAFSFLLDHMMDRATDEPSRLILDVELIERASCRSLEGQTP